MSIHRHLNKDALDVVPLSKYDATAAPGATDDSGSGYSPGSRWADVTNKRHYVCVDATAAAAKWAETLPVGGAETRQTVSLRESPIGGVSLVSMDELVGWLAEDGTNTKGVAFSFILGAKSNLSTNPKVTLDVWVFEAGVGDADATFKLTGNYLGVGEVTSKTADESITQNLAITDTLKRRHSLTFTLDKSKISSSDTLHILIQRQGATDAYSGKLALGMECIVELGA